MILLSKKYTSLNDAAFFELTELLKSLDLF